MYWDTKQHEVKTVGYCDQIEPVWALPIRYQGQGVTNHNNHGKHEGVSPGNANRPENG
jgi:hypothetical protein